MQISPAVAPDAQLYLRVLSSEKVHPFLLAVPADRQMRGRVIMAVERPTRSGDVDDVAGGSWRRGPCCRRGWPRVRRRAESVTGLVFFSPDLAGLWCFPFLPPRVSLSSSTLVPL